MNELNMLNVICSPCLQHCLGLPTVDGLKMGSYDARSHGFSQNTKMLHEGQEKGAKCSATTGNMR